MRAELVHARAASAGGCQDGGDGAGNVPEAARARSEAAQLARENAVLRETVLALHSELFGARLATKYLDKELAGRIQQLQLLGRDMRAEVRDSLWAQVEAEILLQRHKTLVRVCRGVPPRPAAPAPAPAARTPHRPRPRTVRVRRSPHLGLGISVTGGREHGVPILISELEAGGPAALTGELYVGDAILAINDVDLTQACHKEAVQALQSVKGDCALCVQFIATDDDDRLSEDNYRFPLYPEDGEVFGVEPDGSGATPTAPRTPEFNSCRRGSGASGGSRSRSGSGSSRASPPRYDYNSINNNLAILDMDDDNIKIEARLESVGMTRGGYVAVGGALSSPDSPHSTPVHNKRQAKKKRKPQDWRTKGAYRAVEPDTASSDEPLAAPLAEPRDAIQNSPPSARSVRISVRHYSTSIGRIIRMILLPTYLYRMCGMLTVSESPVAAAVAPPVPPLVETARVAVPAPPAAAVQDPPADLQPKPRVTNGDVKPLRRESKGFRIGTARRVTEAAVAAAATVPPVVTNGDGRGRFPARLLAGDGDPDFGTPV
ncbi:hypothetical protein ABMA27_015501 [Loxostege sticticalis]|uniref:PDZ domain-containing protein n=1 Tax=Loxostege sticticalis TaxID=481309 RepID=A0ABR3I7W2_LOXSC